MSLRRPPRAGREGQLAVFGTAGGEIGGHYDRGNGGGQPAFDAFDEQAGAPQPHRTGRNTESRAYRDGGIPFNRKTAEGPDASTVVSLGKHHPPTPEAAPG